MLVGLVQAPSRLDPTKEAVERTDDRRAKRAGRGGDRRHQAGAGPGAPQHGHVSVYITQTVADEAAAEEIVLAPQRASRYRAPLFVYAVRRDGQAAGRREPAGPRRSPHRHHAAVPAATSAAPKWARVATTWIG